jgi:hypothetical protein
MKRYARDKKPEHVPRVTQNLKSGMPNPYPFTLNPQPYLARYHTPYQNTHPKPWILNPDPEPRNSKPLTLTCDPHQVFLGETHDSADDKQLAVILHPEPWILNPDP